MKIEPKQYEFILNPAAIDKIADIVVEYCSDSEIEKRISTRCRLSVEEILLQWIDKYGEGASVTLRTDRRFNKSLLNLEIEGTNFDPYQEETKTVGNFGISLLKSMSITPEYIYKEGKNIFTFKLKKKPRNPLITLFFTIVLAISLGYLGMFLPEGLRTLTLENIITPINDTFLGFLGCVAGPMIFLSVAWGIYGIGDTTTLSRVGKKMIFTFLGTLSLVVIVIGSLMLLFYDLNFAGGQSNASEITPVFQMLLDIFPMDIFSPFIERNTLQIIFLGCLVGIAMLFLGRRTEIVALAVEQINYIVQFLVEIISKLVPFFILIVVIRFIWSGTIHTLFGVSKYIFILCGVVLFTATVLLLYTGFRRKVNPITLIKKGLPTLLIAGTTASSAASFGTNINACEKRYGIDSNITAFGIPLGMVMYKPATALSYLGIAFFFAESYQIPCSLAWLFTAFFFVVIISVATPPIPGGALTAYTVIFSLLGIPGEALAIALAIDIIADFLTTGFNQFLLPLPLMNVADRIGKLDKDILRKNI